MDTTYLAKLTLSMFVFAPGIILLVAGLFVGLLMSMEKLGIFDSMLSRNAKENVAPETNTPKAVTQDQPGKA